MAKRFKGVPNLPFAPIAAVMLGLAFAILAFNTPDWRLERLVGATGLASILPAAKPPLGNTARTLLSVATAIGVSGLLWAFLRPIESLVHRRRMAESRAKARGSFIPAADVSVVDSSEWAARSGRSPIFAESELGAPFMSDEALSKGEELLLDAPDVELDTPVVADVPADESLPNAIDLSAWQIDPEPESAREATAFEPSINAVAEGVQPDFELPVFGSEPAAAEVADEQPFVRQPVMEEPTMVSNPASSSAPAPKSAESASLSELMLRLENALDRRATDGKAASDAPLAGNIASLHELIGVQRKSVL
jgi:hypothetical protein